MSKTARKLPGPTVAQPQFDPNADDLTGQVQGWLEQFSIPELRRFHRNLQTQAQVKGQQLQQLVGSEYREVIAAADSIVHLNKQANYIATACDHIRETARPAVPTGPARPSRIVTTNLRQPADGPDAAGYYALAAQVKVLIDIPELIWQALDRQHLLPAAVLYLYAAEVYTNLERTQRDQQPSRVVENQPGHATPTLALFPVAHKQWSLISRFHDKITERCDEVLSALDLDPYNPEITDSALPNTVPSETWALPIVTLHALGAWGLFHQASTTDLLAKFLAGRKRALATLCDRVAGAAEGYNAAVNQLIGFAVDVVRDATLLFAPDPAVLSHWSFRFDLHRYGSDGTPLTSHRVRLSRRNTLRSTNSPVAARNPPPSADQAVGSPAGVLATASRCAVEEVLHELARAGGAGSGSNDLCTGPDRPPLGARRGSMRLLGDSKSPYPVGVSPEPSHRADYFSTAMPEARPAWVYFALLFAAPPRAPETFHSLFTYIQWGLAAAAMGPSRAVSQTAAGTSAVSTVGTNLTAGGVSTLNRGAPPLRGLRTSHRSRSSLTHTTTSPLLASQTAVYNHLPAALLYFAPPWQPAAMSSTESTAAARFDDPVRHWLAKMLREVLVPAVKLLLDDPAASKGTESTGRELDELHFRPARDLLQTNALTPQPAALRNLPVAWLGDFVRSYGSASTAPPTRPPRDLPTLVTVLHALLFQPVVDQSVMSRLGSRFRQLLYARAQRLLDTAASDIDVAPLYAVWSDSTPGIRITSPHAALTSSLLQSRPAKPAAGPVAQLRADIHTTACRPLTLHPTDVAQWNREFSAYLGTTMRWYRQRCKDGKQLQGLLPGGGSAYPVEFTHTLTDAYLSGIEELAAEVAGQLSSKSNGSDSVLARLSASQSEDVPAQALASLCWADVLLNILRLDQKFVAACSDRRLALSVENVTSLHIRRETLGANITKLLSGCYQRYVRHHLARLLRRWHAAVQSAYSTTVTVDPVTDTLVPGFPADETSETIPPLLLRKTVSPFVAEILHDWFGVLAALRGALAIPATLAREWHRDLAALVLVWTYAATGSVWLEHIDKPTLTGEGTVDPAQVAEYLNIPSPNGESWATVDGNDKASDEALPAMFGQLLVDLTFFRTCLDTVSRVTASPSLSDLEPAWQHVEAELVRKARQPELSDTEDDQYLSSTAVQACLTQATTWSHNVRRMLGSV